MMLMYLLAVNDPYREINALFQKFDSLNPVQLQELKLRQRQLRQAYMVMRKNVKRTLKKHIKSSSKSLSEDKLQEIKTNLNNLSASISGLQRGEEITNKRISLLND